MARQRTMISRLSGLRLGVVLTALLAGAAHAQQPPQTQTPARPTESEDTVRQRVNGGTIGLASAGLRGIYAQVASEMAIVLDQNDDLRIMPIITRGSLQNIRDLLYMRGVDVGIVQSDVLTYLEEQRTYSNIKNRIQYITPLFTEELHVIANVSVDRIEDLADKPVNVGEAGSGTAMTGATVFRKLGINVRATNFSNLEALEKVKNGELAAMLWVSGKPTPGVAAIANLDGLQLLSVPFNDALADTYLPSEFRTEDYPNLVPQGQVVETIALNAVLAAYNWPANTDRYRRVARFVDALFTRFPDFQKPPFHPKWREVNLSATLPGWTRVRSAQVWIERMNREQAAAQGAQGAAAPQPGRPGPGDAMFEEFMRWRERRSSTSQ